MRARWALLAVGAITLTAGSVAVAQATGGMVDPKLMSYERVGGIAGNLSSVGSDTLVNLMTFWAEGFQKQYPNVKIQVEAKGSSTAPPALIAGTSQLGPMSRPMKATEIDAFEKKFGYKPTPIGVALDALGVYVNKDNPVQFLSIDQLDGIFSSTRACGGQDISRWDQLGLGGEWAQPISLYGRNSASGTYGYFKEHALCKGDYKGSVKEQPGSATVVEGITNDRYAIGYSGMGYMTAGVRLVPIAAKGSTKAFDAIPDNVYAGTYPISRYLYIYINRAPGRPVDPLVKHFLTYVLSAEGQEVVVKDGYIPLPAKVCAAELAKLE